MLLLGDHLLKTPVMSLQVGSKIAETTQPIIDPRSLTIVAYEVEGPLLSEHPSFIRIADIRELGNLGMIIDSSDEIVGKNDVVKVNELLALNFNLIGMKVVDTKNKKLGSVINYTLDTDSFVIQQLSVRGGLISSLSSTGHMVHRSQITEISDTTITVKSTEKQLPALTTTGEIHRTYSNPFRKQTAPQQEASQVHNS
jgi:uncharacterized protein YrrD